MNDFDAAVDWLVQSGRCASKGEARRKLTEQAQQRAAVEDALKCGDTDQYPAWLSKIAGGLAGASPALPRLDTSGLDRIVTGAGKAADIGIELANRTINFAGQNAGAAYAAGVIARKRPWWKRIFRG